MFEDLSYQLLRFFDLLLVDFPLGYAGRGTQRVKKILRFSKKRYTECLALKNLIQKIQTKPSWCPESSVHEADIGANPATKSETNLRIPKALCQDVGEAECSCCQSRI